MHDIVLSTPAQIGTLTASLVIVSLGVALIARWRWPAQVALGRAVLIALLLFFDAMLLLWVACNAYGVLAFVLTACVSSMSLRQGQTKPLGDALGSSRFALFLAAMFTISTLVFVHLPITTFLTSPGDLGIHLGTLLTTNVKSALAITYASALAYGVLPSPRMKTVLTTLAVALVPLTLVYAFVYPFGYPTMNGLMFEHVALSTSNFAVRTCVDIATVSAVTCLVLVAIAKVDPKRLLVAVLAVNVSVTLASLVRVTQDRADTATRPAETGRASAPVFARPVAFAKDKDNVLILFLDRFMGGFVEPILEQEPELAAALDGFTWYPRTVAAGENSVAGLHPLLGGYDYTPREMNLRGKPLRDTAVESFAILPYNFTRHGYAANLVNPRGLGFNAAGDCSFLHIDGLNCTHIPSSVSKGVAEEYGVPMTQLSSAAYADLLSLLGAMRISPYGVREVLHERGPWSPFIANTAGETFKYWAELKSLPKLSRTDSDTSNINIVFNLLAHEPYFIGKDCLPKPSMLEATPDEFRRYGSLFGYQHFVAARCTLLLVADYFRWMKDTGVYDRTKIVVVSDHGIVGPVEDHSSRAVAGGTTDDTYVRSRSLLLVKERAAHGALRVSEEFLPNAEVPRIVCEEIGGCTNPYLGDRTIEAHGRNKPFYVSFVPWQFNMQTPNAFAIKSEMAVTGGDPYDRHGWMDVRPAP